MSAIEAPKRAYRLPNGDRLVEVARAASMSLALDDVGRFTFSDGTWIEPRTFLLFDAAGKQKAFFGHPREDALDDYLYILDVHYVCDGALRCGMIELGSPGGVWRCTLSTPWVELNGLVPEGA